MGKDSNKEYEELLKEYKKSLKDIQKLKIELIQNQMKNSGLESDYSRVSNQLKEVYASTSWKIGAPIRLCGRVVKSIKFKTRLIGRGLHFLFTEGPTGAYKRVQTYYRNKRDNELLMREIGTPQNDIGYYKVYDSEYQENMDFKGEKSDIKTVAFFLPQFHTIPENDEWWGKGFTEWVNTRKSLPKFTDHYQPREPHHDIGYYDLSKVETLKKQAELAKQHGIYGFCFYHYWFSGKRLLEKPVDMLLKHPEIDINFCLCWANENWTRAWDGAQKNIIMKQNYTDEDADRFIDDLEPYINDKRYIRINGKPIVMVYNSGEIPDVKKTFRQWRERAKKIGLGEILIWTCQTANNTGESLRIQSDIDAEIEFPPHNMWSESIFVHGLDVGGKSAFIYNYQKLVALLKSKMDAQSYKEVVPLYRTTMMGWDNAARRADAWTTFYAYSLKSFYEWLRNVIGEARKKFKPEERFVFVNAWNEWAEGTYLEPDEKYGYANINTLSKAIFDMPFDGGVKAIEADAEKKELKPKIAVHVHLFYTDTLDTIIKNLNYIPFDFDCYISTDTAEKEKQIRRAFTDKCRAKNVYIDQMKNRGRDVAPLLVQMKDKISEYDYICHIHSKKTATSDYGDMWREYLYRHLFGSEKNVRGIIEAFENNKKLALQFPETYPILNSQNEWGGNREGCKDLLEDIGIEADLNTTEPIFPVGNMFWAKAKAVAPLFKHGYTFEDFPKEGGQVNLTFAHQIERCWVFMVKAQGYEYQKIYNDTDKDLGFSDKKRVAFFVHYDRDNIISKSDIMYLDCLRKMGADIVFITNSDLDSKELEKVDDVKMIVQRKNRGYDFGAWKEGIQKFGFDRIKDYDQLLMVNNSCYVPVNDLSYMFKVMESKNIDFWGPTLFPYLSDGSYINKPYIKEHIQSFFQVYEKNVIASDSFREYWENMKTFDKLEDVVANCETEITDYFKNKGFKYDVLLEETSILSTYLVDYSIPYNHPYELLILGCPFVKKKATKSMSDDQKVKVLNFVRMTNSDLYKILVKDMYC